MRDYASIKMDEPRMNANERESIKPLNDLMRVPRIAVVFATMNRAATAVACVQALAAQTRPPQWVVVADNVSSDGTAQALEALQELPFELILHRMVENRGNAGGVQEAMDLAFAQGADAVWILDDDSWPRPGALAAMLHAGWDPEVVLHPVQEDPKTGRFTWPLQVVHAGAPPELVWDAAALPALERVASRGVWTGALISRHIRETVGAVNAALFIRGEDEEYPWRIEQAGFRTEAVPAAVMDHPGPPDLVQWQFCGKRLFVERGLADWKLHYKVRNMVWLKRRQSGAVGAVAIALAYTWGVLRLDGLRRLPLLWRAACDGWCGRLGKSSLH